MVDAEQWFEVAPLVDGVVRVVDYFRRPEVKGTTPCLECGVIMHKHGYIDRGTFGHIVCPGDWVVTSGNSSYPIKPDVFTETFEAA